MRVFRDFVCGSCGIETERYIDSTIAEVPCKCGGITFPRVSAPNFKLEGITGAFPDAHARWARIREENYRQRKSKED